MIEPKYKIGDMVWFMFDNKAIEGQIYDLLEEIWHGQRIPESARRTFEYWIKYPREHGLDVTYRCADTELFLTKQDLINSL